MIYALVLVLVSVLLVLQTIRVILLKKQIRVMRFLFVRAFEHAHSRFMRSLLQ